MGYVKGMQAEQTVACIKHFALNNQEKDRGSIDVQVDERPLRRSTCRLSRRACARAARSR